ncbi:hypothetical protein AMAG_19781 [Allomyces macrogynus ATCC 38327]|uniref:Uncharacterized protein n=1 Tax=Allomyces macrogynus (strain ATCC 38327) TaxID=578462 RepID=A0A0L0T0C3_ALLM3|nr:hypothetical protein AMAG_19781 [Allomyces macrogynus ATCC 38327]|eukprot:KNE68221.1 hypothetical protein AMAG_19781 [Allomyces macrogynus ATCC 38327]
MSAVARAFASRARALLVHWSQRPASTSAATRRDATESAASVIAPDAGEFELQHRAPSSPAPAAWNDWISWMPLAAPMAGAPGVAPASVRVSEVPTNRAAVLGAAVDAARPATTRARSATRESTARRRRVGEVAVGTGTVRVR